GVDEPPAQLPPPAPETDIEPEVKPGQTPPATGVDVSLPQRRPQGPAWNRLLDVVERDAPAAALVRIDEYRPRATDEQTRAALQQLEERAVDRLWWQRITELLQRRATIQQELADLNQ